MEIDNLTLFLLFISASLLFYNRFFSHSSPLVHPLLLGKQSDDSAVRKKGETGIYRNWATGQGSPLTVRPANACKTTRDLVPAVGGGVTAQRSILDVDLNDEALSEILHLLPIGLRNLFPTLATEDPTPILTLLPPSPSTSLPLLLLHLSSLPSAPIIPLPSPLLLSTALRNTAHPTPGVIAVHESIVHDVLEQLFEDVGSKVGVLIVGDPNKGKSELAKGAENRRMRVRWWEEIWEVAEGVEKADLPDVRYSDVHSYFYDTPKQGETPAVVKVTHINITAGIASLLSTFPADKRPTATSRDVVASAEPLDTPFGMIVALASIYSGAGFRLIGPPNAEWPKAEERDARVELEYLPSDPEKPKPTILFINQNQHALLVQSLHKAFLGHPLRSLLARHKLNVLRDGSVSRDGFGDRWFLNGVREGVFGGLVGERLRAVFVVGDSPPEDLLPLSHLLLSLPISRIQSTFFSAGPVTASHFYDIQASTCADLMKPIAPIRSSWANWSHAGAPASNIEIVLKGSGVEQRQTDTLGRPAKGLRGNVWVRGPGVLERVDGDGNQLGDEGWADTTLQASVRTNGTFVFDRKMPGGTY